MENIIIKNVEVQDLNNNDISGVQVAVEVEILGDSFSLLYQVTERDYGVINRDLDLDFACDENDRFYNFCDARGVEYSAANEYIMEKSQAQRLWDEYIEKTYPED